MADEERFVVSRQDIEELVKSLNIAQGAVIHARIDLEYFRWVFEESLLLIPECLPNIDPATHDSLVHMVRTLNSDVQKHRAKMHFQLRWGAEPFLLQAYGSLGRMLWGKAACKAGDYPDWWRDLLLGDLGDSESRGSGSGGGGGEGRASGAS